MRAHRQPPDCFATGRGAFTTPYNGNFTQFNASKHYQFDEDVAFFKSGWAGTHNIKVGYQYNRMSNVIDQNGNVPNVALYLGAGQSHSASTSVGGANAQFFRPNGSRRSPAGNTSLRR